MPPRTTLEALIAGERLVERSQQGADDGWRRLLAAIEAAPLGAPPFEPSGTILRAPKEALRRVLTRCALGAGLLLGAASDEIPPSVVVLSTQGVIESGKTAPSQCGAATDALEPLSAVSLSAGNGAPGSAATVALREESRVTSTPKGQRVGGAAHVGVRAPSARSRANSAMAPLESSALAGGENENSALELREPGNSEFAERPPLDEFSVELALLKRAKRQLDSGNTAAGLRALRQHEARFPRGVFATERDALRAISECASGSRELGRVLGERFVRVRSRSPVVDRVRRVCGLEELKSLNE